MNNRSIRTVLLITGMRDNACRERVGAALESVAGVREVDVNLFRATATIVHAPQCGSVDFVRAVAGAGYGAKVAGIP